MQDKNTLGVMLTRAQPFHNGHLKLLKKILNENTTALILIGSADKFRTERNPFSGVERKHMIQTMLEASCLKYAYDAGRIRVGLLNDWEDENNKISLNRWGHYLYYFIVAKTGHKKFKFYYGDSKSIVDSWFDEEVRRDIEIITVDREELDDISSTKLREALKIGTDESLDYVIRNIPGDSDELVNNLVIHFLRRVIKCMEEKK